MKRIKIFDHGYGNDIYVDADKWLEENPSYDPIQIALTRHESSGSLILAVLYEIKNEEINLS